MYYISISIKSYIDSLLLCISCIFAYLNYLPARTKRSYAYTNIVYTRHDLIAVYYTILFRRKTERQNIFFLIFKTHERLYLYIIIKNYICHNPMLLGFRSLF